MASGEYVVRKGERGTEMYMVVSVLGLDLDAFERIRRRFPFTGTTLFRNLARVLALRLRHTTTMLVEGQPLAVVPGPAEGR